jgi:hypothetical protein
MDLRGLVDQPSVRSQRAAGLQFDLVMVGWS